MKNLLPLFAVLILSALSASGCVSAGKYKILDARAAASAGKLAQTEDALSKESRRAQSLDSELASQKQLVAELQSRAADLEAGLGGAKTRNAQLGQEVERLETARAEVTKALGAKKDELSEMNLRLQSEADATKKSLGQAQARIADLDRHIQEQAKRTDELSAETAALRKERDTLAASNQELSESLRAGHSQLTETVSKLAGEKRALEARIAELSREQEGLRAKQARELEQTKSTYESLVGELKSEIDKGQIMITQFEGKLTVNVAQTILFASGRTDIKSEGRVALLRLADIIRHLPDKQIRIDGHSDNVPIAGTLREKYPTNWELSAARATTVARFLQDKAGIEPTLLSATGYGEYRPIAGNDTEEGRARNRRIEIVLLDRDIGRTEPAPR